MKHLKEDKVINIFKTKDFNTETLTFDDYAIYVWDLGGAERVRPLWRHYFEGAYGLIFIIDSSDPDSFESIKNEIKQITEMQEVRYCPVLIAANKQDIEGAKTPDEVAEAIDFESIKQPEKLINGSSLINGQGLNEGMKWLRSVMNRRK